MSSLRGDAPAQEGMRRNRKLIFLLGALALVLGLLLHQRAVQLRKLRVTPLEGHAVSETSASGTLSTYVAVGAVSPASERELVSSLEPQFAALSDATLYVWATDGLAIGPRMNVKGIPESTLKALANYERQRRETIERQHQAEIEQQKQHEIRNESAARNHEYQLDMFWARLTFLVAGAALTVVGQLMTYEWKRRRRVAQRRS